MNSGILRVMFITRITTREEEISFIIEENTQKVDIVATVQRNLTAEFM